jgi:hypothetical protein
MTGIGQKRAHHLIEEEAFRRIMSGQVPETLDEFARELMALLRESYPAASAIQLAKVERQLQDIWHRRHEMVRGGSP